jgi:galactose mutarotase-like enzyme
MGTNVPYVTAYLDNHQQMRSDLKDNENDFENVKEMANHLIRTCDDQIEKNEIKRQLNVIDQKWFKLKKSVDERINAAEDFLKFINNKNQKEAADIENDSNNYKLLMEMAVRFFQANSKVYLYILVFSFLN